MPTEAPGTTDAKIQAIYWDIGGVLLTNGWDHEERARVLAQFSLDRAEYEARHEAANDRWERGEIDDRQFLDETIFYKDRSFTPEQFLAALRRESQWLPGGARYVLAAARQHSGLQMAMLNNESGALNDYRIDTFGLAQFFDGFFCSAYLGMRKPEPRIFTTGVALFHLAPEVCCFVDDRAKNCAAAAAAGMHAIQYSGEQQLTESLRALGVRMS